MKNFLKAVCTHLFALCLFFGGLFVLGLVVLGVLAAAGARKDEPEKGSILVFDLSTNITDAPPSFDPSELFSQLTGRGEPAEAISLRTVLTALEKAAKDDKIAGLHLVGSLEPANYGSGFAALKEVRAAIKAFGKSGKPVSAYLVYASNRDYYLASAADSITLNPFGALGFMGLASEGMFFKNAFEKYGVGVQVTRVGRYKSAAERFFRENWSAEEREQKQRFLGVIWDEAVAASAVSRKLEPAVVQAHVDRGDALMPADALQAGLVTQVAHEEQVLAALRKVAGKKDGEDDLPQITLAAYARAMKPAPGAERHRGARVAVLYAEGVIVDGEGQPGEIGGDRLARQIRELREEDGIKALVVRVNSPGGSATASDVILAELRVLRETRKIPVVVSMGTVAASGGYWIATEADAIVAQPNTITGSIGVWGLFFNVQEIANRHGITFDTVKTGEFADMLSISRPKNEGEMKLVQTFVDQIYDEFIARVARARNLPPERVKELAQGRVWIGVDAKENGLVDQLGGLEDAIRLAAGKAKLGEKYSVVEYPRAKDAGEVLAEMLSGQRPDRLTRAGPAEALVRRLADEMRSLRQFNDPRGLYLRLPYDVEIR